MASLASRDTQSPMQRVFHRRRIALGDNDGSPPADGMQQQAQNNPRSRSPVHKTGLFLFPAR
jgi:hypothetical protein